VLVDLIPSPSVLGFIKYTYGDNNTTANHYHKFNSNVYTPYVLINSYKMSSSTQDDDKSKEQKKAEQELGIVEGKEEKEPNPDTTGPEENLREKAVKMADKSQESKEPA
jgi:hypothetical protein